MEHELFYETMQGDPYHKTVKAPDGKRVKAPGHHKNNKKGANMPKIQRSTVETAKTILIVALITAMVSFVGGMRYQQHQTDSVKAQVQTAVSTTPKK